jgi:hypothetical protein
MKAIIIAFALAALALSFNSKATGDDPSFIKSFDTNGPVTLQLSTSGGSIGVHEGKEDVVLVEFYVRKSGKRQSMSLEQLMEYKDVEINQNGNEIEISVKNKRMINRSNISVAFIAYVPKETSAAIATSGGGLKVSGLNGYQKLSTSGGGISVHDINGNVNASTSGGSIKCDQINGDVNVSTSGGSIKMIDMTGNLDASTSGGSISLEHIAGSTVAATSGGSINADFLEVTGDIKLATSGGSINVNVPNQIGADVYLSGSHVGMELGNFSGDTKRNRISGTVNGGGHKIECRTSGGGVKVY